MSQLHVIVLAAGQGKRMCSSIPKVLQTLAGKPMLQWVVSTAEQLNPEAIHVIYGHGGEQLREALPNLGVNWVKQAQQLGTGHAVMQALPEIPAEAHVMILSGDVPLIQPNTLADLAALSGTQHQGHVPLALLVANLDNPVGLGRIVRNTEGQVVAIVEEKDATPEERQIHEIYSGMCCASAADLARWLPALSQTNAQGEYYLTEIIAMAVRDAVPIASLSAENVIEIAGVNHFEQLQQLERIWQQRQVKQLMLSGTRVADAARVDIRGELVCGKDVFIDVNAVFEGQVTIGEGCIIEPNCYLKNVTLGPKCVVHANSVLEDCYIGDACHIGPFARLRPGTQLADRCKIGNFVETKNAVLGENSKASHLSYLGDTCIGQDVNIGAGTITCNYDGANKHQTIIEDGVFIGSDTQLVAPVVVGKNATIGAGSTIRKNVPAEELTLTVSTQKTITGWKRPRKN
jgi:bifunctional UDP-N-acetylglucosamine pyrophosphorylase/glucosamine-1-phosphate N-acetyltransferase